MVTASDDQPIELTWRALARHADECDRCSGQVQALARVPDDPGSVDAAISESLCRAGEELLGAWWEAKAAWLERTRPYRQGLGVLGADLDAVKLRNAAWSSMPDHEVRRLLALPDAERFRILEAVEAGILARRGQAAPTARRCAGCGQPFTPRRPSDAYCSRRCRTGSPPLESIQ